MLKTVIVMKKLILVGLIVFISLKSQALPFPFLVEHIFRLEKFEQCPEKGTLLTNLVESNMVQIGKGKTALNAIVNTSKDINLEKMEVKFFRCKERSDPSCEQVIRYVTHDSCKMLHENSEMWSSIVQNTHPRLNCPVKKGIYKVVNGTLDFSKSRNLFFNKSYWRILMDGYEKKVNILCFIMEFEVVPYRNKYNN